MPWSRLPSPEVPFDLQPALTGAHVELRPLRPEDFGDLYAVGSDPAIWEQHPHRDLDKQQFKQCRRSRPPFLPHMNSTGV
jgi:hypothetical protein